MHQVLGTSNCTLATTDRDLGVERWALGVNEPFICGTGGERLDVVV
jgi:hypothetical protein